MTSSIIRSIFYFAAGMLSMSVSAGSRAQAQNLFCPTSFTGQTGIHFDVNECTNGNTGAYSNAGLAAQALTDLSQSSTQDSNKATMAGVANRRTAEEDRCPEGLTRIGGVCRSNTARATPFAAEPTMAGAWPALPGELLAAEPQLLAYASTGRSRMPVKALQVPATQERPYAVWAQLYGDYERRTGRAPGIGEFSVLTLDAKSTSGSAGAVGGLDMTVRSILSAGDGLLAGVLTGFLSSTVNVATKSTTTDPINTPGGFNNLKARLSGPSAGLYVSYFNGGFSGDLAFKADFLDLDISFNELLGFGANPALGIVTTMVPFAGSGSTKLNNYTTSGNLNYKMAISPSVWLQPTAGFQYVSANYGANAAQLGLDDGRLVRLQGGVRVGFDTVWNQTPVTASVTGLMYDNVQVKGGFIQNGVVPGNPLILNDEGKLRAQGTLALNFQHGNGVSSFVLGEVRGGEDLFGAAGRGGVRVAW